MPSAITSIVTCPAATAAPRTPGERPSIGRITFEGNNSVGNADLEEQEHDGDQVEPDVEPLSGCADGVHAGFVGHALDVALAVRADEGGQNEVAKAEGQGAGEQDGDGPVMAE